MIGHWITFTGTSILNSNLGIEDINFGLAGISIWNFILFWAHDYFHIFSKIYPVIGVIYFIFCIFHLRSAAPWKHPAKRIGAFDQNHEIGFSGNLIEVSSAGNSIYIYSDFSTRNQLPRCLLIEHKTCDILAAEQLRLKRFENRLIIDSFQEAVCLLKW